MKNIISIIFLILLISFVSCSKVSNKNMTVIKDCTGSYLRLDGKDYHICNIESVEDYESGTEVKASFKKIDDCQYDYAVCEMLHLNEGWINVTKIE